MKGNKVEILLIEDNVSDAELTIRALKKKNLANNLIHLSNGAEAIDFIFAQGAYSERDLKETPKVILLDLKMPKIGGLEVLQRIRSDERTRKIPVVVITSSNEDADINACYEGGVNSYIVKPVEFDAFMKVVSDIALYWISHNQVPHHTYTR